MEIKIDQFEGPFDLLLQLIETEELDITEVSLLKVAEQYIGYLDQIGEKRPDVLADFLVIAARLLFLKSRALLPEIEIEDEEGATDLEVQLKLYKKYFDASKEIESIFNAKNVAFSRENYILPTARKYVLPSSLNKTKLRNIYGEIMYAMESIKKLSEKSIQKVVSIKKKIHTIRELLSLKGKAKLSDIVVEKGKREMIVSFLGMLELSKQGELRVDQSGLFGEIIMSKIENS